jgi:hypothetical protein
MELTNEMSPFDNLKEDTMSVLRTKFDFG